jgi:hypothetical protein
LETGIPLSEINKWDLEDIFKAFSLYAMKQDYSGASIEMKKKELEPDK